MNRNDKWYIAIGGIIVPILIVTNACIGNYDNILWILYTTFLLWHIAKQNKEITEQNDVISNLHSSNTQMHLNDMEKKLKCALDNCKMYLQRIIVLKSENERLRTINKNLIETKFKGKANGNKRS